MLSILREHFEHNFVLMRSFNIKHYTVDDLSGNIATVSGQSTLAALSLTPLFQINYLDVNKCPRDAVSVVQPFFTNIKF